MSNTTWIVADIETTGLKNTDKVVEIAWREVNPETLEVLSEGCSLINPGMDIPLDSSQVHGIMTADVANAPTMEEYMKGPGAIFARENVIMVAHNCVTPDHEVRTQRGWVRISELEDTDQVMQWDPHSETLELVKPLVIVSKQYSGPMLEWSTVYHKGVYTPEHRFYFKGQQGCQPSWSIETAKEVSERSQNAVVIPTSGFFSGDNSVYLTQLEARILEMIRADGNIVLKSVRFKFKRTDKIERCKALLDAAGQKYKLRLDRVGVTAIRVYTSELTTKLVALLTAEGNKSYGPWLLNMSKEAKLALLDEIQFWDGSKADQGGNGQVRLCTVCRGTAEWLYELATLSGFTAKLKLNIPNTRGFSRPGGVIHQLTIRPRKQVKLVTSPVEITYSGNVYCVTVPSGAFMVRRDGATWITGNCAFDFRFLQPFMHETAQPLCTLKCAKMIFPESPNHKQGTLALYLGHVVDRSKAHSADGDLDVLLFLLKKLCEQKNVALPGLLEVQCEARKAVTFPFGKHKGKKPKEVDVGYCQWVLNTLENLDADLRAALEARTKPQNQL